MPESNRLSSIISRRLSNRRLFYVCRDLERAAEPNLLKLKQYRILSNTSPYSKNFAKKFKNIILVNARRLLDTRELLEHPAAKKHIRKGDYVVVFKNMPAIEKICAASGWNLLNPPSRLSSAVEEKISQIKWLGKLGSYLPKYKTGLCRNVSWQEKPFILQFNRSHTGSGTIYIDSDRKLETIKNKFPMREVKTTEFIKGPVFTNNNVVWRNKILFGNISYQITGLPPFTLNEFSTIGNDWPLPDKLLAEKQKKQYFKIAGEVGKKLKKDGWKGLFGIDAIMDEKTKKLYLLEINARQPASSAYESRLQTKSAKKNGVTVMEAHVAGLLGVAPDSFRLSPLSNGAQIIQRVTEKTRSLAEPKFKTKEKINLIKYNNAAEGQDLLRIQSAKGIMKSPGSFNNLGEVILAGIITAQKKSIV